MTRPSKNDQYPLLYAIQLNFEFMFSLVYTIKKKYLTIFTVFHKNLNIEY